MRFEWDEDKARDNKKKHGISFKESIEVFDDPFHVSVFDKRFEYYEERWITIGKINNGKVIIAGHLYSFASKGEEVIRIITAREATIKERKQYEEIS